MITGDLLKLKENLNAFLMIGWGLFGWGMLDWLESVHCECYMNVFGILAVLFSIGNW